MVAQGIYRGNMWFTKSNEVILVVALGKQLEEY